MVSQFGQDHIVLQLLGGIAEFYFLILEPLTV